MRQVIFSLDTQDHKPSKQEIAEALYEIKTVPCIGCYKGIKEKSFIASIIWLDNVLDICKVYNQESVLIIDNGKCFLYYIETGLTEYVGLWRETDQPIKELNAYTAINGRIYIAA